MTATMDPVKTEAAAGKVFGELGVFLSAPMLALGDRLGLFQELLEAGPLTSIELADRTGYVERYLREWLRAVAIGGYVTYDPDTRRFHLEPEMGAVLTDGSPISMIGVIPGLADLMNSLPAIEDFVRNGGGRGWRDAGPSVAAGQARFTRPMYLHGLVHEWLPAISGVAEKLQSGARVMDVGCGYGVSTALAAEAWPASTFVGTDIDPDSVTHATNAAAAPNVTFVAASATSYGGAAFDLVMMLDCLHDMGDPVAAIAHARTMLADDGVLFIAEPLAADRFEDDFANPYARIGYAISTLVCTPSSLSQPGALGLGAMAGEAKLRQVLTDGGFTRLRRLPAQLAPFNILIEARP